jgi:single-stranded DNA-binding protein
VCIFEGRISKDPEYSVVNSANGNLEKVTFDIAVDRAMSSAQKQAAQANNQATADFIHCQMVSNQNNQNNRVNTFRQWYQKGKAIKVVCHYNQYTYVDKQSGQTRYGHQFDVDDFGFTVADSQTLTNNHNNQQQQYAQPNNGYQQPQYAQPNNGYQQQPQNNFMNAPQPQQQGNFQMFDSSNSASPF